MPANPAWVKALKPSGPQGSELLAQERNRSQLPVESVSEFLFSKEHLESKRRILKILQEDPVFDKTPDYYAGRAERFERALARAKRLRQLKVKHSWTQDELYLANGLISDSGAYLLHDGMFTVTIREQGTPEQHEKFLRPAERYEYIGCYAQTELGHGSNVRGLETVAEWQPDEKCFILHSPHLTASKWWIGNLGLVANYAVLMAQLVIRGKSYGPHPFVVQIRDLKTHEPLENVHIGDIGPKFGFNSMDNGFLLFNKVKIPHISMLARFSRVDPETNEYVRPPSASLVYGTMTLVRASIVKAAGHALARGVTIATRYSAVRRQFVDKDAPEWETAETPVLNYRMVEIRLLTNLAATFALHFTGKTMMQLYQRQHDSMNKNPGNPELSGNLLADLHATSCGLKALASSIAAEGLETCRRACGGHGYSNFSGIGPFYTEYLQNTTVEGDNYLLTQQVARYLLKSAEAVLKGAPATNDTTTILKQYLSRQGQGAAFDVLNNDADIVSAYAWRASFLTFEALKQRQEQKMGWNDMLVDFYRLSKAHSQYLVVKSFYSTLEDPETVDKLDRSTLDVFRSLFRLYALHTMEQEGTDFFAASACNLQQLTLARTKSVMSLLKEIRPHVIRLVDAWDFPDYQLDSSLGRYDGRVYEDLFVRASERNPLNNLTIDPYPFSPTLIRVDKSQSKL
ncbi:uncharacterized protein PV09_06550 [Verruconis gallopava]|uniref:Acyl-coenzyme A oxidase n=1 Tax=Verruconis gallopava TaxID=253628 RepID=A0A0D2A5Q7_9PEZI|nr:uncharacterized protein PV09_06550 [Verruconis gallopava]KIW02048.1 hypothetical protein PV09_06550 [Verruconis gallopava]